MALNNYRVEDDDGSVNYYQFEDDDPGLKALRDAAGDKRSSVKSVTQADPDPINPSSSGTEARRAAR